MPQTIKPLVAGNWKMNGSTAMLKEPRLLAGMMRDVKTKCDILVCPPAILTRRIKGVLKGSKIKVGGQDCHAAASGAHTGDISAEMLKDSGATYVIVGHSERRTNHKETDATVAAKAKAAHRAGLIAIICIGETLEQRKGGQTLAVLSEQLKGSIPEGSTAANTVIAYEPVWAIGTGLTAINRRSGRSPHACALRHFKDHGRRRCEDPHSLWWFRQTIERRGTDGGCQCERRAGRWRKSQGR